MHVSSSRRVPLFFGGRFFHRAPFCLLRRRLLLSGVKKLLHRGIGFRAIPIPGNSHKTFPRPGRLYLGFFVLDDPGDGNSAAARIISSPCSAAATRLDSLFFASSTLTCMTFSRLAKASQAKQASSGLSNRRGFWADSSERSLISRFGSPSLAVSLRTFLKSSV